MCVYLAPRWRRRSLLATLMLALTLLLSADAARALRSVETQHPTGNTTGSGSASVSEVQVGDLEAGVVTTGMTQSTTTFTKKTWGAGSHNDVNKKSVSFTSLVQSTATSAPSGPKSASSASGSTDNEVGTPSATSNTKGKSATSAKQGDDDDSDGSFDVESSDDSSSDSKTHDKTTGKSGTSKSNTSVPTPTPTPTSTPAPKQTTYHQPQPTHPGSIDIKPLSWSEPTMHPQTPQPGSGVVDTKPVTGSSSSASASGQPVQGQSFEVSGSANNAASFEKSTKSAASTTSSRSLDETLVFVIVGVVGAIGALLMFVSRKVLQETGDDEELTGASFF
ncbi:hypothetical protein PF008_g15618 [Phytophthora fragariae]|uniref:RxLR effector protein n=1 Tax=Phytophthora fragariae TaxID=53985 RepID=A0A6G0RE05_9STRA|nr:hypothetical protein PF008_g15618 [Phytophthora fragariae]